MREPAKNKAVIALNVLLHGLPVTIDKKTYHWCEGTDGRYHLFQQFGDDEDDWEYVPLTLECFIELCQKMTNDEAFLNNANVVLVTMNRKERNLASERIPEAEPDKDGIVVL